MDQRWEMKELTRLAPLLSFSRLGSPRSDAASPVDG
jgi:hypothetical protein